MEQETLFWNTEEDGVGTLSDWQKKEANLQDLREITTEPMTCQAFITQFMCKHAEAYVWPQSFPHGVSVQGLIDGIYFGLEWYGGSSGEAYGILVSLDGQGKHLIRLADANECKELELAITALDLADTHLEWLQQDQSLAEQDLEDRLLSGQIQKIIQFKDESQLAYDSKNGWFKLKARELEDGKVLLDIRPPDLFFP